VGANDYKWDQRINVPSKARKVLSVSYHVNLIISC
jgi:hypothetical protein